MFRKYDKTYRLKVPDFEVPGKNVLSKDDAAQLLNSKVIIEEKLDGANTGIIRHKNGFHLQKRGSLVGQSEHIQFQFFHNWANRIKYVNIMDVPKGFRIYGELMYCVHTIYYDKLPDYFLVFDVQYEDEWLNRGERTSFCDKYGFFQVPLVGDGVFKVTELSKLIPKVSRFGSQPAEGIVIKKYNKNGYWRAKLVRPEFIKRLEEDDEHWTNREVRKNKCL